MTQKKIKLGVYGGKFDPIHIGHLICAEWTREHFGLDLVKFVVSANPPHKKTGVLDGWLRFEMVDATVKPNCYFEACDIELRRDGPSYMLDTLRELQAQYGDTAELYLLLSAEYLDPSNDWRIDKWHGAEELFKICTILCFPRDVSGLTQINEWKKDIPQARIEALACPSPPVSSSLIRERVAKGLSIWYMVTAECWRIIRDRGHYADPNFPAKRISCKRFNLFKPSTWLSALVRTARSCTIRH